MTDQAEDKIREQIRITHQRLHGRRDTHKQVAKHSYWTSDQLTNVLKEDDMLFEQELMQLIAEAHKGYVPEAANDKNYHEMLMAYGKLCANKGYLSDDAVTARINVAALHLDELAQAVLEAQIMSLEAVKYSSPEEIDARIADKRKALPPHNPTQAKSEAKVYTCPQCGPDPRGDSQHAWYAHTFGGLEGKPYVDPTQSQEGK